MREILFRAQRLDNGEWVEGDYYRKTIQNIRTGQDNIEHYIGWQVTEIIGDIRTPYNEYETINPSTLCQFTGLRDKNGERIWEGDILEDDCGYINYVKFGKLPLDKSGDCVCTYPSFYCECKGKLGVAPYYECQEIGEWMIRLGSIHDKGEK